MHSIKRYQKVLVNLRRHDNRQVRTHGLRAFSKQGIFKIKTFTVHDNKPEVVR